MRILFVLAIAVSFVTGLVSSDVALTNAPVKPRPNVIFILTDDLDSASVAYMPKLKSLLIDQGTSFDNFFVNVSLCCPSRTSILMGQYSHNTKIQTNGGTNGGFETAYRIGIEKLMVSNWLREAGYRTAHIGKYLNGYPRTAGLTYVPPGWDDWESGVRGNPYSEFNYTLNENGKLVAYGSEAKDYGTDLYVARASAFIRKSVAEKKPFFVQLAVYAPHGPATPAPRHAGLFADAKAPRTASFNEADVSDKPAFIRDRPLLRPRQIDRIDELYRKRLQSLQSVDDAIESLIETLKATDQLANTYIFFTSDNGFHLGQHRLLSGKQTAYDEDIAVPMVVRGPGVLAGAKREHITGNIDFAPTFAAIAGIKMPSFVDGRSLLPILSRSAPAASRWREAYLIEHWRTGTSNDSRGGVEEPDDTDESTVNQNSNRANQGVSGSGPGTNPAARRNQRLAQAARNAIPEFQAIRTRDYLYVEYVTGEKELYDLRRDPFQLDNITSKADALVLKRLAGVLGSLRKCAGSGC